jgi:hypothetical protein
VWGTLSDESMGLYLTVAAGNHQRRYFRTWVPQDSQAYYTVCDLSLPQPAGQESGIYIPQEQECQVIPPGTGSPIRRFAGLRLTFSNRLHAISNLRKFWKIFDNTESPSYLTTDGRSVSQSVCMSVLVWGHQLWASDQFVFVLEIFFINLLVSDYGAPSLTREGSVIYWSSPAYSLSGPCSAELTRTFYFLKSEIPESGGPGSRIYFPRKMCSPVTPPLDLPNSFTCSYILYL